MAPEAFFLPVADGRRFCLFHAATGPQKGALIYLHPFAEEMNKARRMAALQSRMFSDNGYAVLQIDLLGCGDSSGDFGDASWQSWLDDVGHARAWLRERCSVPLWLWGLRAGCLLATEAAARSDEKPNFLFWQPTASGRRVLQQFLRLRVAGQMMNGDGKGMMEALKRQLDEGRRVEVAGYTLSPSLAGGLDAAELLPPARSGNLVWLELSTRPDATLAPDSLRRLDRWRSAGYATIARIAPAPPFWQATEIEEAPALLEATLAALEAQVV